MKRLAQDIEDGVSYNPFIKTDKNLEYLISKSNLSKEIVEKTWNEIKNSLDRNHPNYWQYALATAKRKLGIK